MDYAIELQNVCKNYDNFKLDHVTMNVPKGSVVAVSYTHLDVYKRQALAISVGLRSLA